MSDEPVTEQELAGYLDGALELEERLAVETFLAANPDAAARFMNTVRADTALRLLSRRSRAPTVALDHAAAGLAKRLEGGSAQPSRFPASPRTMAALAVLLAIGVGVGLSLTQVKAQPPDYVGDAVMSYRTGLLRAAMVSQIETPQLDSEEIRRRTQIRVPHLPEGWTVTDVQIFPSDDGPALQIMVRTAQNKSISIFAVRSPSAAPPIPVAIRHGAESVAYWRKGEVSYALTGIEAPGALDLAAEDLALD